MSVLLRTVTVNAAFLREIKEDSLELRRLLAQLREAAGGYSLSAAPRLPLPLLEEVRDQLALHFSLEEAYGYFDDPVAVAPQLGHWAETLRGQHADLFREFVDLVEAAEMLRRHEAGASNAASIAARCRLFLDRLERHEAAENDLLMEAFAADIGVGD